MIKNNSINFRVTEADKQILRQMSHEITEKNGVKMSPTMLARLAYQSGLEVLKNEHNLQTAILSNDIATISLRMARKVIATNSPLEVGEPC